MTNSFWMRAAVLAVAAVCTLITRALPFALFGRGRPNATILYLGSVLPAAVMAILVVYCLRSTGFSAAVDFLPELAGVATVIVLHLWKRNNLLSIAGGTAVYMVLLRLL
ncbi:MAG: branched-chain amino acid transporter permease [Gemmiger sp.]